MKKLILGMAAALALAACSEEHTTPTATPTVATPTVAAPTATAVPTISLEELKAEVQDRLTSCEMSLLMPRTAGQRVPQYSDCDKLRQQLRDLKKYGYILPIDE